MAKLTDERDFVRLADAEDLRVKSRTWRRGEDRPPRVDRELTLESMETVSNAVELRRPLD